MQRAMEACRQLDFPPDTLASSELKIKDLRHNLDMHCSDDVTRVKVTSSDTEKSRPYMCCCFVVVVFCVCVLLFWGVFCWLVFVFVS